VDDDDDDDDDGGVFEYSKLYCGRLEKGYEDMSEL